MTRRSGLGKGLDALIPSDDKYQPAGEPAQIPIEQILANPRQPRTAWDPAELASLASSIQEHGILQPLVVRRDPGAVQYTLIAGERRLRAAQIAGLETVPVVIRQATDQEQLELALIENLQRTDLNPMEAAEAYRQLKDEFDLSEEEIGQKVGRSRSKIANSLRLFELPTMIQQALINGVPKRDEKTGEAVHKKIVTEGHAIALLMLKTHDAQITAFNTVIDNELSVRATEELVRKMSGNRPVRRPKRALPADINALEDRIRVHLGTRVQLRHSARGHGSLSIYYFSEEELDAIINKILHD